MYFEFILYDYIINSGELWDYKRHLQCESKFYINYHKVFLKEIYLFYD